MFVTPRVAVSGDKEDITDARHGAPATNGAIGVIDPTDPISVGDPDRSDDILDGGRGDAAHGD